MKCDECGREVTTKKYEIFNCPCGKNLMIIEVNRRKEVVDVTLERKDK